MVAQALSLVTRERLRDVLVPLVIPGRSTAMLGQICDLWEVRNAVAQPSVIRRSVGDMVNVTVRGALRTNVGVVGEPGAADACRTCGTG